MTRYILSVLISLFFSLFLVTQAYAAPPARQYTYTSGNTITASQNTANEDAIFTYLQAGVDTYKDNTIVNADVNSSANIQSDKLNLTSIAQGVAITSSGSFTNAGATTLNGALTANGNVTLGDAIGDTLTIDAGTWTLTNAATWTLTGALTFSGTIADLGTVTTADINGGTLDGVQIGGTTSTGELIVNDSNDNADGLGSQGTSGQYLASAGSGSNPTWSVPSGLSNVIFAWSGVDSYNGGTHGAYAGTSSGPTMADVTGNLFLIAETATPSTLLRFQFTKISGISTVTIHARMWAETVEAGEEAVLTVNIGGQSNTVKTVTSTTPTWVTTADIDVSVLSDGTTYDGVVQLNNEDDVSDYKAAYCSAVTLIAS